MPSESSVELRYKAVGVRDDMAAVVIARHGSLDQAEKVAKALSGDPEFKRIEIRLERSDSPGPP